MVGDNTKYEVCWVNLAIVSIPVMPISEFKHKYLHNSICLKTPAVSESSPVCNIPHINLVSAGDNLTDQAGFCNLLY